MSLFVDIGGGGLGGGAVKLDPAKMARVLRGPDGPVVKYMLTIGDRVKDKAQAFVGVDTGNLRDHIVKRIVMKGDGVHVEVGADVPYAIYHHEGSDAVEGKLMVFRGSDGTMVFTMRRKAIPPNRFLIRALNATRA